MAISIVQNDIIMANSPFFITYSKTAILYDYIKVSLWVWNGLFTDISINPQYTLTSYKVKNDDTLVYLNIQDFIKDYINPIPNSSYFTGTCSNFNEMCNFQYTVKSYKIGNTTPVQTITSGQKMATLGYGYHRQGSNPILSVNLLGASTIDSTFITIDSTFITMDNSSLNFLSDNTLKWHNINTKVYNLSLNTLSDGSDVILRNITTDFRPALYGGLDKAFQIMYLNKNGLFDTFTFPKASKRSIKFKNESYTRLTTTPYSYDVSTRTKVVVNKSGIVGWTFNTDLLNDSNVQFIEELLASDRHYIVDYITQQFIPINLVDMEFIEKSSINDRAKIQYTLKFEEANEYINNIK